MHFSYRGFEQHNGKRQFTFLGLADKQPERVFHFTVDLTLLTQHSVSIQETPSLCAELLAKAAADDSVDTYGQYALSGADLLAFTAPRRALAASRGKKQWVRPKPSAASQPFTQAWGVPPVASS
jgi:hypothetical protein